MAEGINELRIKYAAYRKKAQQSPEGAEKVMSFKKWLAQRKKGGE